MVHITFEAELCSVIWFVMSISLGNFTHVIIHLPAWEGGGLRGAGKHLNKPRMWNIQFFGRKKKFNSVFSNLPSVINLIDHFCAFTKLWHLCAFYSCPLHRAPCAPAPRCSLIRQDLRLDRPGMLFLSLTDCLFLCLSIYHSRSFHPSTPSL